MTDIKKLTESLNKKYKINESYRMEESRGSSISIRSMERDIEKAKNKLKKKAKQNGVWENFGQDEVRKIDDKYGSLQTENYAEYSRLLNAFSDWCANYTPMSESYKKKLSEGFTDSNMVYKLRMMYVQLDDFQETDEAQGDEELMWLIGETMGSIDNILDYITSK